MAESNKLYVNLINQIYPQGLELAKKIGAAKYMECSAWTGEGMAELFELAGDLALEYGMMRKWKSKRISTLQRLVDKYLKVPR